jgi:hypothetical protein
MSKHNASEASDRKESPRQKASAEVIDPNQKTADQDTARRSQPARRGKERPIVKQRPKLAVYPDSGAKVKVSHGLSVAYEKTEQHRVGRSGERGALVAIAWTCGPTGEVLVSLRFPLQTTSHTPWAFVLRQNALHAVVHLVVMAGVYNRKSCKGGFVPVPISLFRKIAGGHLGSEALTFLIQTRVIESDGIFRRGEKSKGYRFSRKALGFGFTVTNASKRITERLCRARNKRLRKTTGSTPVFAALLRILKTVSVAGDAWADLARPVRSCEVLKRIYRILAVEDIRRRHWYFSHDEKTGRCFNNVTNFPRDVRPFLLIGGQPTAECDIANSQPLFLAGLAYGSTPSAERTHFVELVRSGQFYETVGQWAGLDRLPRETLKKRIYTGILFGRNHRKSKLWDALANQLPLLAAYIERTKRDAHNALALALQKKEAEVMLGQIVPRLLAEGCPVLSIHDGCLCRIVDAERVRQVMEEEVEMAIGIKPTVKVKSGRPVESQGNNQKKAAP